MLFGFHAVSWFYIWGFQAVCEDSAFEFSAHVYNVCLLPAFCEDNVLAFPARFFIVLSSKRFSEIAHSVKYTSLISHMCLLLYVLTAGGNLLPSYFSVCCVILWACFRDIMILFYSYILVLSMGFRSITIYIWFIQVGCHFSNVFKALNVSMKQVSNKYSHIGKHVITTLTMFKLKTSTANQFWKWSYTVS